MKIVATVAVALMLGAATPALAQYAGAPPGLNAGGLLPPREAMTIVRSMGFEPVSRPVLRGPFYVVNAVDDGDIVVRVAINARSGRVVRVTEGDLAGWQGGRFGAYALPPQSVPPGAIYRRGTDLGPEMGPRFGALSPKLAPPTPLPRPAPPEAKAAAPASEPVSAITDHRPGSGKSVPAPVGNRSSATAAAANSAIAGEGPTAGSPAPVTPSPSPALPAARSPGAVDLKPTQLVPVAPLE